MLYLHAEFDGCQKFPIFLFVCLYVTLKIEYYRHLYVDFDADFNFYRN